MAHIRSVYGVCCCRERHNIMRLKYYIIVNATGIYTCIA